MLRKIWKLNNGKHKLCLNWDALIGISSAKSKVELEKALTKDKFNRIGKDSSQQEEIESESEQETEDKPGYTK